MSTIYSASQIVGKNLFAKKAVQLYRLPADNAKAIYTVNAGDPVGVVTSYLAPKTDGTRNSLYWQFKDQNGKYFYARHNENTFDIKALKEQGVKTVEDQTAEDAGNADPFAKYFKKYGIPVLIGAGAIYLLAKVIEKKL